MKNKSNIKPSVYDMAFSRLLPYVRMNFPEYKIGKHHKVIAKALEKAERGEIRRLAIFMPPRSGKTMLASEYFASWYLGRNPDKKVIFTSYSQDRADDVGRTVRNHLLHPIHKEIFPNCTIDPNSKASRKFNTLQKGDFFAVGVGGAITGRGANVLILDDLIKDRADSQSALNNRKREEWFTSTAYTRLMPGKNVIILIMTRWSYDDIATFLLEEKKHENWTILNLPAVAIEDNDIIGRQMGEALWEEAYPLHVLNQIKEAVGTQDWNALYQQQPIPEEGGMVKLDWFKRYNTNNLETIKKLNRINLGAKKKFSNELPVFNNIVISLDTAFKQSSLNDPSAFTVWGTSKTDFILLEAINERLDFPDLKKKTIDIHKKYSAWNLGSPRVLIEDAASGQSLIQELRRFTNIPVIPIKPDKSKEVRMSEVTSIIESGRVWFPKRASWLVQLETQLAQFPLGKHDDLCDSISQFLRWSGKPKYVKSKFIKFWK